ncbi:unnamed protein product, partial [Urochloa humidicola]
NRLGPFSFTRDIEKIIRRCGGAPRKSSTEASRAKGEAMKVPELALRLCVIPLAVASLWEMATNSQADDTYGEVKFSNISGFTYLVGINAITAAYALASILLSPIKSFAQYDWLILVLDQIWPNIFSTFFVFSHLWLYLRFSFFLRY